MTPNQTFKTANVVWMEQRHAHLVQSMLQRAHQRGLLIDRTLGPDNQLTVCTTGLNDQSPTLTPMKLHERLWNDAEKLCILNQFDLLVVDHARMVAEDELHLTAWEIVYPDGPGRSYVVKSLEMLL